ncbi:hypothetical protein D9K79_10635 [Acinetobacter cumulans]|uniref:Uncharacterized protein n=1 Tax=Acinetobacter cumulans TaxID=2136182 RepID=A0A498D9Z0_9GAMM|nr:hypothetical protein [Acinetobacter cumulans]RLL33905.1 hypothetical protein D9K80_11860 [Acinetobacter cumulans]RLL43538.1 hypothetical protein D9K79_10635 [Acinetobacter cumulans]
MTNSALYNTNPDDNRSGHTIIFGTTGYGKSQFMSGVPIEYSKEELQEMKSEQDALEEQERKRNLEIKKTYIAHGGDVSFIDDIVKASELVPFDEKIPEDKLSEILFILDDGIFFQGLRWAFDDTEVRSELYQWLEDNQAKIKEILD